MPFKPVVASAVPQLTPDAIIDYLHKELPGWDDLYYTDLCERITITAIKMGYSIASVAESFVIGAKARGEDKHENE